MAIVHPPTIINAYLKDKLANDPRFNVDVPFFPSMPSTIDQLTQSFPEGLFAVYDRMFKMRRRAFPHIKDEQLLYYFYKTAGDPELLIETSQMIQDLLDRGDESGQEVNAWLSSKIEVVDGQKVFPVKNSQNTIIKTVLPVYFHDFKIYQLEETRDIIDFGTARTYAGNKIIIDYCYHTMGHYTGNYISAPTDKDPERKIAELDPTKYNDTTI